MPATCNCGRRYWMQQDGRPIEEDARCPACLHRHFEVEEDSIGRYLVECKYAV